MVHLKYHTTHIRIWSVNELLTMCVQEEERLKYDILKSVYMTTHHKGDVSKGNKGYDLSIVMGKQLMEVKDNRPKCFFCKKKGHVKKDYLKYQKWLSKIGNLISCVCYESNFSHVSNNT